MVDPLSHGLLLNPAKYEFGKEEIDFFGYRISASGTKPNLSKVEAIRNLPSPTSCKELQQFVGMMNFYHRCVPHFANIMDPLYDAMNKRTFTWTQELQYAFDQSKTALANATLLHHPQDQVPTALTKDASDTAIGAVLKQQIRGIWQPVAFYSRKLRPAETRYSTFDRELLAIYLAIRHFRHFLEARPFTMYTDHKPLVQALTKQADLWSLRQQRRLSISKFSTIADGLSRCFSVAEITWDINSMDPNKLAES